MKTEAAAQGGHLPPLGMGVIMRSVRTPHGVQHAWRASDSSVAWITYGNDRVRMWGSVELVRNVIEAEAWTHKQPATVGWEVAP